MGFEAADLLVIAIGGVFGATLRWLLIGQPHNDGAVAYIVPETFVLGNSFPTRTLLVNVIGCLVLGALTALLLDAAGARRRVMLGAATGFCGSLTTFSTFTAEAANLLGPSGDAVIGTALAYVAASLVAGGAAFVLGRSAALRATA